MNGTIETSRTWLILLVLFMLALVVRIIGIDFGYLLGDERINDAAKALSGQVIPGQHFYPPLFNYINALFFGLLYIVGRIFFWWDSIGGFRAQYFEDPTIFYLTARLSGSTMAATISPMYYLLGRTLGFTKASSVFMGLIGIILPSAILLSHIAKSDIALASAAILVIYTLLLKLKNPDKFACDILLGLALSLALSFKHSYLFAMAPIAISYAFLFIRTHGINKTYRPMINTAITGLLSWSIFNIGILLDFQNFLEYQRIQAEMSIKNNVDFIGGLLTFISIASHHAYGITWIGLILYLVFPVLYIQSNSGDGNKFFLLSIWGSTLFSIIILIYLSGTRQQSGLWIPYFVTMQFCAAILIVKLWQQSSKIINNLGTVLSILLVTFSFFGAFIIWQQTFSKPVIELLSDYVKVNYGDGSVKIATSYELDIPQQVNFANAEYERHERMAAKYNISLPERALERAKHIDKSGALPYTNLPGVMFGLENADDESLGDAVKPFAWPLQREEWVLEQWIDEGYLVFIVKDIHYFADEVPTVMLRGFFNELKQSCALIMDFKPVKPLLWEHRATIFDCRLKP